MSTEKMREQLRRFYTDSFAKLLKIRKAKKNIILYKSDGIVRTVIARFDMGFADASGVENTCSLAVRMADACKDAVLGHLVDVEMDKLDDKVAEVAADLTVLVNTVPPLVYPGVAVPEQMIRGITPMEIVFKELPPEPAKDTLASFLGQ